MIRDILASVSAWFRRGPGPSAPTPPATPAPPINMTPVHVFPSGNFWGHHVEWNEFPNTIWGHIDTFLVPQFMVGAVIAGEMQSGRIALFQIKTLDWKADPRDMFFGTVAFVAYAGEEAP